MKSLLRLLVKNWPWKLLSLGAAALLWMAVASEPEMASFIRVPVVYKNAPQSLEISSTVENFVTVQATGVSGRLRDASLAPLPVVLDLSSVRNPGAQLEMDAHGTTRRQTTRRGSARSRGNDHRRSSESCGRRAIRFDGSNRPWASL